MYSRGSLRAFWPQTSSLESNLDSSLLIIIFSMAVPFVEDWDVVQILGEGAYGEYESSISAAHYTLRLKTRYAKCFCNFADSLIITVLFLCFFLVAFAGWGCSSTGSRGRRWQWKSSTPLRQKNVPTVSGKRSACTRYVSYSLVVVERLSKG